MNNAQAEYVEIWKALFSTLLGWSSERVLEWADQKYTHYLIDPNDIIYHESPLYWAADTLIDKLTDNNVSSMERIEIRRAMLTAYWDLYHDMYSLPTDLIPFKTQVEIIVKQHREKTNGN